MIKLEFSVIIMSYKCLDALLPNFLSKFYRFLNLLCKSPLKSDSDIFVKRKYYFFCTDGNNILHTLLVKHYNDLLDRQSSKRSRDEVT